VPLEEKGDFRFAAWYRVDPIALLPEPIWVLNCDRKRGSRLRASSTSYPFHLPLLRFSSRVRTYKSTSIALSAVLSHQNIKGSGAFATYRCTRFCRRGLLLCRRVSPRRRKGVRCRRISPLIVPRYFADRFTLRDFLAVHNGRRRIFIGSRSSIHIINVEGNVNLTS